MPRIQARRAYWRDCPPSHLLLRNLAIWAGAFVPPAPEASLDTLRSLFPDGKI